MVDKNLIYAASKNLGHSQCEREARVIFTSFHCINRLTGHSEVHC